MTDTNQLPPSEREAFEAEMRCEETWGHRSLKRRPDGRYQNWQVDLMWEAWQARAQVQGHPSWWMRETDEGAEWTDTAPLVLSGWTPLYTTPQPAQATQAEVTDTALIRELVDHVERNTCTHEETHRGGAIWEVCDSCGARWADDEGGKPEFKWPAVVEKARAILALRPQQSGLTGCNCRWGGDTQVQWCELHLAHKEAIHEWTERAKEAEKQLALRPERVPGDVVRDAERYRWLAGYCRSTSEHWGGRWSIIIDGPAPKTHDSEDDLDAAIDAAMLAAK